ncbi:recombinase family protein [Sphingorhabdus soli]|uniref:Recombinase family protein n=1 Tax=Flavisphingopyxis soli TaxID=2601267 RepID=A0A5C6U5Y5_9SPHN|nr:recombinase family protein [Sphingorhabdus soli]TXC68264.1 recombinase family protein [Sphingorhabdus soli]
MLIGYRRSSTSEQVAGYDAQEVQLLAAGCTRLFGEMTSSVSQRDELCAAIEFSRDGDVLVVADLSRLARSISDLCSITERLEAKGVTLKIFAMNLDTSTATGKLLLNLMGSFSQFEREIMLERQRNGVAKAKAEGRYRGRAPTARRQSGRVAELHATGKGASAIAAEIGISRSSVYRILSLGQTA